MTNAWKAALILSLIGNAIAIGIVINHYSWIAEVEKDAEKAIELAENAEAASEHAEEELEEAVQGIGSLRTLLAKVEPFDPTALEGEIDDLSAEISNLSFRLDDVEYQIERPPGCYRGDPVYWASGFRGGLTC